MANVVSPFRSPCSSKIGFYFLESGSTRWKASCARHALHRIFTYFVNANIIIANATNPAESSAHAIGLAHEHRPFHNYESILGCHIEDAKMPNGAANLSANSFQQNIV